MKCENTLLYDQAKPLILHFFAKDIRKALGLFTEKGKAQRNRCISADIYNIFYNWPW